MFQTINQLQNVNGFIDDMIWYHMMLYDIALFLVKFPQHLRSAAHYLNNWLPLAYNHNSGSAIQMQHLPVWKWLLTLTHRDVGFCDAAPVVSICSCMT